MTVWVDNMYAGYGRMKMCHLMASTTEELLAMIDIIGVNRKWKQKAGTTWEHFDIAMSKRKLAVSAGAIEVTMRDLGMLNRKRQGKSYDEKCVTCQEVLI